MASSSGHQRTHRTKREVGFRGPASRAEWSEEDNEPGYRRPPLVDQGKHGLALLLA